MHIIIRKATLKDLKVLLQFEQNLIMYERTFDKTFKDTKITYYDIKKLITEEDSQVIMAEHDNSLIGTGCALLKKSEPFENFDYYSYLGFMFVSPRYRGKGINRKIINSLINWSKKKGVSEIRLEVYEENEVAILSYEKFGFNKTTVKMSLKVI